MPRTCYAQYNNRSIFFVFFSFSVTFMAQRADTKKIILTYRGNKTRAMHDCFTLAFSFSRLSPVLVALRSARALRQMQFRQLQCVYGRRYVR